MMDLINQRQQKVDELSFRLERTEKSKLEACRRRWEGASAAVRHYDARRVLSGMRHELDARIASMATLARSLVLQRRGRIETLQGQITALSPVAILDRGYALVFDSKGRLLKDPAQVFPGEQIRARVAKGEIVAKVEKA
jgi:exodeoxyribonuclease VII large subunit